MKEYDENDAISYIRNYAGDDIKDYSDDDILEVIDLTFDFFDQFSEDDDIDIEVTCGDDDRLSIEGEDAEALFDYVRHLVAKDKASKIRQSDIPAIVTGEILYEETLS